MKLKFTILLAYVFLPVIGYSQDVPCNCAENLKETIAKTEANYAGFNTKVNKQTRSQYSALLKNTTAKASVTTDKKQCYYIIKQYIRFFKDKHFSFTYSNKNDFDKEILVVNETDFSKMAGNGPEGIWINPDSSLTLGIKKMQGVYKAVIIKTKNPDLPKGLVYFSLTPHKKGFLLKQYNVFNSTDMYAVQRGNLLQLWNFALFARTSAEAITDAEKAELLTWRDNNNGLDFKMLDDETSYVKIPTFFNNDNKIAKLIAANDKAIRGSKYLIIDLRGNGGGSAGWSHLLPYVMTDAIKQNATILRISEDNVKLKRSEMEYFVKNPISADLKPYYTDAFMVDFKKAYDQLAVLKTGFLPIPAISIPMGDRLEEPAKVALITDGLCGSSAEYFFYLMKQSKKTTRYGTRSVGMMDYEGPSNITRLPCNDFILMIPIAKSSWTDTEPIDEVGFKPDVIINKPYGEWVNFIRKDIKQR